MPTKTIEVSVTLPAAPSVKVLTPEKAQIAVARSDALPAYDGDYSVTPGDEAITINCHGMRMAQNLTINPVPSNYGRIEWNGSFLAVF